MPLPRSPHPRTRRRLKEADPYLAALQSSILSSLFRSNAQVVRELAISADVARDYQAGFRAMPPFLIARLDQIRLSRLQQILDFERAFPEYIKARKDSMTSLSATMESALAVSRRLYRSPYKPG